MEKYLWPAKIAAKMALSRLPVSNDIWRKLGLFRLGKMDTAQHAHKIFTIHRECALEGGKVLQPGFVVMELGPGDSIASAILASGVGAEKVYLSDVGSFANKDAVLYKNMSRIWREQRIEVPNLDSAQKFEDILKVCRAQYLSNGLDGLKSIPSRSVDFIWSHSVIEHIRLRDFQETLNQLARIIKLDGIMSHSIDLKDHLSQSLNNLRFSQSIWEKEFFARSGFYTNRLRASQIVAAMETAGFESVSVRAGRWPSLPLSRRALAPEFRNLSEDDLFIRTLHLIMKPVYSPPRISSAF